MEVGARHDGLCDPFSTDIEEACCGVGDSRLAHQVGAFSSSADDLHTRGILQVIRMRDYPVTWNIVSIVSDRVPGFTTHFWKGF